MNISKNQLDNFKQHAITLANALSLVDSEYKVKGRKRVDLLAQAIGYRDHGSLCAHANKSDGVKALCIFTPRLADMLIDNIVEKTGWNKDKVATAVILSAFSLYTQGIWEAVDIKNMVKNTKFTNLLLMFNNKEGNIYANTY